MTADQWNDYVQPYERHLADLEAEFARQGGSHDFAVDFADQVLDLNLIKLNKSSKSYHDLCRLALDAALEVQRRIVARLHGREFPDQPDPRFVGPEGQAHRFVPVRDQTKQAPQSASIHSLIDRYVNSTHRLRTKKTRKSLFGYLETMATILGPGKDAHLLVEQDEEPDELQKPVWPQKTDQQPVLLCGQHRAAVEGLELLSCPVGPVSKDGLYLCLCEPLVLQCTDITLGNLFLAPCGPELPWGISSAIPALGPGDRQQKLRIGI